MAGDVAKAWAERIVIPTYRIGEPDKNPMFLEKRVYQGSSGAVYPHPVIDRVTDERYDAEYLAVFLENRYLKIMVLPQLGGRVQMALDKTNGYHFIYHNRVIKPALVGLAGPWISGGIEFNWPQHHRPSTFDPVRWQTERGDDGSATVWCSEIERMYGTQSTHGLTLYADRAYLEVRVRLYNGTPLPQTFLWWANPAVHADDNYQSVFPPDVHAVMDHGKRAVSTFPIATGTYYKVDYAPGTDIARYKNIPVPTSYMAYHSDFDFLGCYDDGAQAGMLHVADHHIVPGKKQWTWGCGDFGKAWDRQLTDEDGPYVELMCGAYTDNQPDFSWLMPGEEKTFTQVFMPYKLIGPPKNASTEAAINLEFCDDRAQVGVYVTQPRKVRVRLLHQGRILWRGRAELTPEVALLESVPVPTGSRPQDYTLQVFDGLRELLVYTPQPDAQAPLPQPATPAPPPATVDGNEELYLNGLHLEQYHHATYAPEPYYEEALRRDPNDSRCNNALGLLLLRRGRFAEAEPYFRRAIERLTLRNPNPYDGEPFYNLGLALKYQSRGSEAFDAFYKAAWNAAWQGPAYLELARLAAQARRWEEALSLVEQSLAVAPRHHVACHLKIVVLRKLGRTGRARAEARAAVARDPMAVGPGWEIVLLERPKRLAFSSEDPEAVISVAMDYAHAGLFWDAAELLETLPRPDPMAEYFTAWFSTLSGRESEARAPCRVAQRLSPDYVFPNRLEAVPALETAMRLDPQDPRAPYYLGNFWYAHRRHQEAIACWERARELDPEYPTVHRNLGLAYFNQEHDGERARAAYDRAFALDPGDARVFFELDQLGKRLNEPPERRLARLEAHVALVAQRDDLAVERATLLNVLGRPAEAYEVLMARTFHPWEGGEGKVTGQYVTSLVEQARAAIATGDYGAAIEWLGRAQHYPPNLGEGKLYGAQENHVFYYLGRAYAGLGEPRHAQAWYQQAAIGPSEPASARYYNDQPPEMIFYQGLARAELGQASEAAEIFRKLVTHGERHLDDDVQMDYFAVSLPDFLIFDEDLNRRNRIHCHYMMALGYLGLGDQVQAEAQFRAVLDLDANHLGAALHRRLLVE